MSHDSVSATTPTPVGVKELMEEAKNRWWVQVQAKNWNVALAVVDAVVVLEPGAEKSLLPLVLIVLIALFQGDPFLGFSR